MKTLLKTLFILTFISTNAQIVNIPDPNFKTALTVNHAPVIDTNNDGEIQVSEAEAADLIDVNSDSISDLTGIEAFINLSFLDCSFNNLTSIDVSNNTLLEILNCSNNQLTSIDISNNPDIFQLECRSNNLSTLDISSNLDMTLLYVGNNANLTEIDIEDNTDLAILECSESNLTDLDLSNQPFFISLVCNNSPLLKTINLQNGNNENFTFEGIFASNFENMASLENICIDNIFNKELINTIEQQVGRDIIFTEDCETLNVAEFNNLNIKISPNPTSAFIKITSTISLQKIQLLNNTGMLLVNISSRNLEEIDLSALSTGIYFLKINTNNGDNLFKRIIKY